MVTREAVHAHVLNAQNHQVFCWISKIPTLVTSTEIKIRKRSQNAFQ